MVSVFAENKEAYCCLTAWRAGHSKIMCSSSASTNTKTGDYSDCQLFEGRALKDNVGSVPLTSIEHSDD